MSIFTARPTAVAHHSPSLLSAQRYESDAPPNCYWCGGDNGILQDQDEGKIVAACKGCVEPTEFIAYRSNKRAGTGRARIGPDDRARVLEVAAAVLSVFGCELAELTRNLTKGRRREARDLISWVAARDTGLSLRQVANPLPWGYECAGQGVRRIDIRLRNGSRDLDAMIKTIAKRIER